MSTNRIVLCLGQKGQGKSYSIKRSLDKLARHVPVYVWDPNREYAGDRAKDGIRDVDAVFRSWPEFLEAAAERDGHIGRVVIQVGRHRFEDFCKFVHRCGGCTVALDELHDYLHVPEYEVEGRRYSGRKNTEALRVLFTTSRHRRINIFVGAWRPTDLPPFVRHAADEIRAWNTLEVNDLKWYRGAGCGEDFVYRVQRARGHVPVIFVRGMVPPQRAKDGIPQERSDHRGHRPGRPVRRVPHAEAGSGSPSELRGGRNGPTHSSLHGKGLRGRRELRPEVRG